MKINFDDCKQIIYNNTDLYEIILNGQTVWKKTNTIPLIGTATRLDDLSVRGKRVLVRIDLNPIQEYSDQKIKTEMRAHTPTIMKLCNDGARVIVCVSVQQNFIDFEAYAIALTQLSNISVKFAADLYDAEEKAFNLKDGEILLINNLMFGTVAELETTCDDALAKRLANLCDVYVNDAPKDCAKIYASVMGVPKNVQELAYGFAWNDYFTAFELLENPRRPSTAIVGGTTDKYIRILDELIGEVDFLYLFGRIGKTVLKAKGYNIFDYEFDRIDAVKSLLDKAAKFGVEVFTYDDVVVSDELSALSESANMDLNDLSGQQYIVDIGVQTVKNMTDIVGKSKTVYVLGQLGTRVEGTENILKIIAQTDASVILTKPASDIVENLSDKNFSLNLDDMDVNYLFTSTMPPVLQAMPLNDI